MRASGPLTSLLAFAMAAIPLLTTRPADAQSREILLPLTFNEVAKGDVSALMQGDDVFMKPADLERFGVTGLEEHAEASVAHCFGNRALVGADDGKSRCDCVNEVRGKRRKGPESLRRFGAVLKWCGNRRTFVDQHTVQLDLVLQPQQSARNFWC